MIFRPALDTVLPEKTFNAGTVAINYAEGPGNGPPVVLLHGIGRRWRDFLPLLPAFENLQVFALDLRGHGKSGRTPNSYQSGDYSADVVAFLKQQPKSPAVIFGHSLGGIVAMRVAANVPELVRAIIVGDSVLSRTALAHSMYQELFAGLLKIVSDGGSAVDMERRLAKLEIRVPGLPEPIPIGDLPGNDSDLQEWANCLQMLDPTAIQSTIEGRTFSDFDSDGVLSNIRCSVLILQANPELGGLMSDGAVERIKEHVHRVEVVRFRLLGHALHLQRAEPVIEAVQNFLSSI
ncbi:MAG TPA: alpha/beta hydrolase [Terriglobales bacterium]|nr:alpha/beta hydrolase [Terriglobales bacterium]